MATEQDTYIVEFKGEDNGFSSLIQRMLTVLEQTEAALKETSKAAEETGGALKDEGKAAEQAAEGSKKLSMAKKALNTIMSGALLNIGAQITDLGNLTGAYKKVTSALSAYSKAGSEQQGLDAGLTSSFLTLGQNMDQANASAAALNSRIGELTLGFGAVAGDEKLIRTMTDYTLATRDAAGANQALENILKISRITGKDVTQIQEQYTLAIKGGSEPLMKYGGLTKVQAERIAKMTDETKKAAEVNKIMTERFKDVSLAGDDAQSAIARFNNATGGDLSQAVGQAINDTGAFQVVLGPLSKRFEDLQGWVKANGDRIKEWALAAARGIGLVIRVAGELGVTFTDLFFNFRIGVKGLQMGFELMTIGVKNAFNAISKTITDSLSAILERFERVARAARLTGVANDIADARRSIEEGLTLDVSENWQAVDMYKRQAEELMKTQEETRKAIYSVTDGIAGDIERGAADAAGRDTRRASQVKGTGGGRAAAPAAPATTAATAEQAGPTDAERAAVSERLLADQQKLIAEYYKEEAIKMKIAIIEQQLTEEAKAQAEAELRVFEIDNNAALSDAERKLALLESERQLQSDLEKITTDRLKAESELLKEQTSLLAEQKKAREEGVDAFLAGVDLAGQGAALAIKDRKALSLIEGGQETARAAGALALGFAGDPTKFFAAAKHTLSAVSHFKVAGQSGGGGGAGGGGGGGAGGGAASAAPIDIGKAQRDNAKAIAEAISASNATANSRAMTINFNSPTVLGTPEGSRQFVRSLEPELRRVIAQGRQ